MPKIDFKNAFNSHRRDTMLRQVRERFPEIYPMVSQAYQQPTPISFGDCVIQSRTGCQQGDVFFPLLFCLEVQDTLQSRRSKVAMSYLDDFTLISTDPQDVIDDIRRIQEGFSSHALEIQPLKCEVSMQGFSPVDRESIFGRVSCSLPGCRLIVLGDELFGGQRRH